ncbi:N-acetylmuramoyl-L-alanine amidase [Gilliamella intestini]|uniref:N-acetylmuramoyl-L-alanine amidase n=1 Tax=Gilliamella intestini TaxID=1798183 RepID=A0A1C4DME2_9GAMM|nr:N-acetylmuramoyl-L-alanine amidase [Gilliamella intestini]
MVPVESSSPKKDVRNLQVLRASNKTKRKVLVELGFITSPKDAKALFSNIDLIAQQLYEGLLKNFIKRLHNEKNNYFTDHLFIYCLSFFC